MEFKIGMISKMTGLSTSGIRFLEEKGFIRPSGGRKGKYRNYGVEDVTTILDYRNNRSCGLSQDEILKIMNGVTPEECEQLFERRCEALENEMQEKMRLLHHLRVRCRDIALTKHRGSFWEVTERPAVIWLPLEKELNTPFLWPEEQGFQHPYASSKLLFEAGELRSKTEASKTEVALGLLEDELRHCGFMESESVRYFPRHKALHMIVEIGTEMTPTMEENRRISLLINSLVQNGTITLDETLPVLTKRILSTKRDGKPVRYDNLWIDVI